MKRLLVSAALCLLGTFAATSAQTTPPFIPAPVPGQSPRNANYTLAAELNPSAHTITGSGTIRWRNITRNPTSELRLHLYWNAWRDDKSSWIRETALGRTSMAGRPAADRGSIDITAMRIRVGDLLNTVPADRLTFVAPDDGNADDRTVLSVALERPVVPGEEIDLHIEWTSHVPRPYSRTGVQGQCYFIAQWFPKLGVLEDAGWNCHQFHAATEFFSDFGTYNVSLTIPSGWNIGATGVETGASASNGAGTMTKVFAANDVHDFAWTTSPDFVVTTRDFNEAGLPPVKMRLLLQKEHGTQEQIDRHFNATAIALRNYGRWFGPYPYEQITIVDPVTVFNEPAQGGSTGGMEYPTLFTAGTRWKLLAHELRPESVTIHEAGHQFWYGIVATNEFENAWMDEGFNTYSTARAISADIDPQIATVERYFGGFLPWAYEDARWTREVDGDRLNAYRLVASFDQQSTPTWRYWPGSASSITYNKTALWLNTLEKMLGWEKTQKILSTYFQRWSFKHPTPQDFFAVANEVSGTDLTWFFDAVHRSSATFDYAVGQVTADAVALRRIGDGVFPVDVRITYSDGAITIARWNGAERWKVLNLPGHAKIETVEIDPDNVLLLDVNRTNNSWTAKPEAELASKRWTLRWITWAEELLLTYGFFS